MEWLFGLPWLGIFIYWIAYCSYWNEQDFKARNHKHDPYLLERGWMLEEDAEELYSRMIRQRK